MLEAEKRELIERSQRKVNALHLEMEAVRGAWTEAVTAHGRLVAELEWPKACACGCGKQWGIDGRQA